MQGSPKAARNSLLLSIVFVHAKWFSNPPDCVKSPLYSSSLCCILSWNTLLTNKHKAVSWTSKEMVGFCICGVCF